MLREIGGDGQQKLRRARVLVVGAGGLGAPVLLYLAAAGVGTITIVDDDTVARSDLQRQIVHAEDRVGMAIEIGGIRLVLKDGGKSGRYEATSRFPQQASADKAREQAEPLR